MKRHRPLCRQSPRLLRIAHLAESLADSASWLEKSFWERQLLTLCQRTLAEGDEKSLEGAIERLYKSSGVAYEALLDTIEAACETRFALEDKKHLYDAQLFAMPVMVWSRFSLPTCRIPGDILTALHRALGEQIMAPDTRYSIADSLLSSEQMPGNYVGTYALCGKILHDFLAGQTSCLVSHDHLDENTSFLADARYLIGIVTAKTGSPLFRWQTEGLMRESVQSQWDSVATDIMRPVLLTCASQWLLPSPFHSALRQTDAAIRQYALNAALAWLGTTINIEASAITVIIAPFYDIELLEYRISFILPTSPRVAHGCVWQLTEYEDEQTDVPRQIERTLRDNGATRIKVLEEHFRMEYCYDCGSPLFVDGEGELVHAEFPEEYAYPIRPH